MSTIFKKIKNRVLTTIKTGSSINNTDDPVIFNVTDPTGFPDVPFYITVEVINDNTVYERMLVTDVTGDQLTATRAQDGSTKQAFSAGDLVMIRFIAAHLDEATEAINKLENIKDYADSPQIVSGGEISAGSNSGTFKVSALTALLRKTNSETGELVYVTKEEEDNIGITSTDTIYIVCLNYNSGSPTISLSETNPYLSDKRNISIGKVMKDGSGNVHFISGGFRFQDGVKKLHQRAIELRELELETGSSIEYKSGDYFTMTAGVVYGGVNRFSLDSYDSSVTTFTPIYRDNSGGWIEGSARNTIDCSHYDDGSGTLATIGNNKYGCHWVYKHIDDDDVYVVYGRGSYTLAEALLAKEPSKPAHLTSFGCLIGKIIAPKNGGSFAAVQMVTEKFFTGTEASDHGNLTGLTDDDHTQYALLAGRSGGQTLTGGVATGESLTLRDNPVDNNTISIAEIITKQDALTFGIADTNAVKIDDTDVASGEYARFTANGLEGRSYSEVLSDLSGQAGSAFDFNSQNLTNVGDIGCGAITATSYDGISAANLLDKSANEIITGYWTFQKSYSTDTSLSIGFNLSFSKNVNSNRNNSDYAFYSDVSETVDEGFTNTGKLIGLNLGTVFKYGLGTLSNLYGAYIHYGSNGENRGTITNAYGLVIKNYLGSGTSSIGTNYGLKIEDMVGTTQYAIYTGTGKVHFGDDVEVAGGIAMSDNKITGLADPTADQDAATKKYTDSYVDKTTADINYYIDCDNGNDSNPGTSAEPFATIQHAIDLIPKNIRHIVTIYLKDSLNYSESVEIKNFFGGGQLIIKSLSNDKTKVLITNSDNVFNVMDCNMSVIYIGYMSTRTTADSSAGVFVDYSMDVWCSNLAISDNDNTGTIGIQAFRKSRVSAYNCSDYDAKKCVYGIDADYQSQINVYASAFGDTNYHRGRGGIITDGASFLG